MGLYCMVVAFQREEDFYPIVLLVLTTFLNCLDFEHSKNKVLLLQCLLGGVIDFYFEIFSMFVINCDYFLEYVPTIY